jgi:hypothetical protein
MAEKVFLGGPFSGLAHHFLESLECPAHLECYGGDRFWGSGGLTVPGAGRVALLLVGPAAPGCVLDLAVTNDIDGAVPDGAEEIAGGGKVD